jgi:hypothetical protein
MTARPQDVFDQLKRIRMDLTAAQAKLSDVMKIMAALDMPEPREFRCPYPACGIPLHTQRRVDEHLHQVHGSAKPPHWAKEDAA